ncbi:uncharacterized protein LOC122657110 isoform X5 [Telopea speciosissima]|uniref:uncharacterized protein LOC122657110 isoform X5 n=1 Tax=Telopea speciosissima TaxID=54955 RepID=UPI001CC616E0|nr:uncharacterized protein LOC122657110 isoform X5 [Telopea speciosissima]
MNCLLYVSSASVFSRNRPFIVKTSLYGYRCSSWKRSIHHTRIKAINVDFMFTRFHVQCYSTWRGGRPSRSPKLDCGSSMEEKDAFYIIRKGDIVGVYKSISDCQAQVGSSVCDPSASVFKGYSLPREAEEYLVSRGLKNATYSISALDVKEDLFGKLIPCPFQVIDGLDPERKHIELETSVAAQTIYSKCESCILEFDGASKGNPGQAGAGAVLRAEDGSAVFQVREGVGFATNNVAEYRAIILGMKHALKKGFKKIHVKGDSKLVYMQVRGQWKTKNQNMSDLCEEVKELKDKFVSFQISHFVRSFNSEADAQANLAINLQDGEVQEDCVKK